MSSLKSKRTGKARIAFDLGDAKWTKCARAPSEKELAKKPVGTIFFRRVDEKTSVYVKVEEATGESSRPWRHAFKTSLGRALAHIEEIDERNAKRPDDYEWMSSDYDVATALKGKPMMTGIVGVAMRVPLARIDVKKVVLARGKWGAARVSDVNPAADDLGKSYRVIATNARGETLARVYVKIGQDDWIQAVTPVDIDEAAEITTRLHEDAKYPRYMRRRDKEIREALEHGLVGEEISSGTMLFRA